MGSFLGLVTANLWMRYFFHVLGNGITIEDGTGTVLSGPEAARLHASVIAGELAQDGNEYRDCEVYAVDDGGNEIARLPVVVPS
jgi:hypothetical protein